MAALVAGFELKAEIHLLRRLDLKADGLAVLDYAASAVGVEGEVRVHEVAVLPHQPGDAAARGLLVGRQDHDEVPVGNEALLPVADEHRDQRRDTRLVVAGAAAVVVAVLLLEDERVERPVLLAGLDDVHVRHHQDRLEPRRPSAVPGDQALVPGLVAQDVDVAVGDPGRREPAGHGFRGLGRVAGGVAGIDLHELLQDAALEGARIRGLAVQRRRERCEKQGEAQAMAEVHGQLPPTP